MATFDDIYEVRVRVHIVTEEMRKNGIFQKTLCGFILDFNQYTGILLAFKDAQPSYDQPITLQKIRLRWADIIDITVLPTRAQQYKKKEDYLY